MKWNEMQYHCTVKQIGDENKEKNQLRDIVWFNTKFSELTLKVVYGRR